MLKVKSKRFDQVGFSVLCVSVFSVTLSSTSKAMPSTPVTPPVTEYLGLSINYGDTDYYGFGGSSSELNNYDDLEISAGKEFGLSVYLGHWLFNEQTFDGPVIQFGLAWNHKGFDAGIRGVQVDLESDGRMISDTAIGVYRNTISFQTLRLGSSLGIMPGNFGLEIGLGASIDYVFDFSREEELGILDDESIANRRLRFQDINESRLQANGRTIKLSPDDFDHSRFGVNLNLIARYFIVINRGLFLVPGIYADFGLTEIGSNTITWRHNSFGLKLDVEFPM